MRVWALRPAGYALAGEVGEWVDISPLELVDEHLGALLAAAVVFFVGDAQAEQDGALFAIYDHLGVGDE